MASYSFKLPDIGEGIAEAEIVAWHVRPGDRVEEDAPLCDMMTDKATVEMTAPVSGTVTKVAGEVGDMVAIGAVLAEFETEGGADAEPTVQVAPNEAAQVALVRHRPEELSPLVGEERNPAGQPPGLTYEMPGASRTGSLERGSERSEPKSYLPAGASSPAGQTLLPSPPPQGGRGRKILASPAVRDRARNLGIDLAQVKAAGDRVRHADLDAFLTYNQGYRAAGAARAGEQVRVVGLRRRIAENMAASKRHIPHFTYVEEFDVTKLEALRADLNDTRGGKDRLTILPFLIVATCKALPAFPMINARYDDEAGVVTRFGAVHLGIATQTDAGLMVPVIRDAQALNIWQLAAEVKRLAEAARSGKAKSEDLSGSTLTLSSLGPLGGIAATPVINRPEVAILGPNKVVERPIVRDGQIAIGKMMNLSISCDHRVVDGYDAASFVHAMKRLVETPALLFID